MPDTSLKVPTGTQTLRATQSVATGRSGQAGPDSTPEKFEAMLLGVLLDQALPKGDRIFGKGVAGNVARSQLGEQLAQSLAKTGALGIAAMLANAKDPSNRR